MQNKLLCLVILFLLIAVTTPVYWVKVVAACAMAVANVGYVTIVMIQARRIARSLRALERRIGRDETTD